MTDVFAKYKRAATFRLPTNIIVLDVLLAGGIPPGDYVEWCSDTGLGKSTACLQLAKVYLKIGWVLILDFEQGLTDELLESMGLTDYVMDKPPESGSGLVILQPITYGDGERILDKLDGTYLPNLVIVDSVTSMLVDKWSVDSAETKKAMKSKSKKSEDEAYGVSSNKAPGVKARAESAFLLKYKGWARKNKITFVYINQIRTKFTRTFKAYTDSAGGNCFKFLCDIRIFMKKVEDLTRDEMTLMGKQKVPYGNSVDVLCRKNRGERSGISVPMDIIFGKGVSNLKSLANALIYSGEIEQSGSYFIIHWRANPDNDIRDKVKGWKGLLQFVRENLEELKGEVSSSKMRLTSGEIKD